MSAVPTPGRRPDGDAGGCQPILLGSTPLIIQAMGGWVKRLYEAELITKRWIV